MKVTGKVIVVTGAGAGIGRELALELLERGAHVALVDRDSDGLTQTKIFAGEYKERVSLHPLDLTDQDAVFQLPSQVMEAHGSVDGIINNAGIIQPFVDIVDLEMDTIKKVMDINFYGTLYMVKSFLPILLKRPEAHILNVSSMGGFLPVPGQSIYGASKAAVKLMTEGLISELQDTTVGVTVAFPGGVETDITKNSGADLKIDEDSESTYKLLQPREAAQMMVDAMEDNKARIYAGKDSKMMNRLYRLMPKKASNMIAKKLKTR
ncbi:MAG: SDR family NAD(P)-dependent oxidoreductase [Bacillota bacterium]